jgi:GNAT superfamily N-acetyltransferase
MWPVTAPRDGVGQAGVEFAQRHGFSVGNVEVKRVLRCPVPTERLDELAASAAPWHEGYVLRSWTGPVPDDLLESWAVLTSSLTSEAPTGDLHVEPEAADVEAVRENERLLVAQGRTAYRCVAIAPDGTAVGYTELVTTVHEPGRAYQWGTLVHGDHRGHRLGLALKVATQRAVQETGRLDPAGPVDHVLTWNADSNTHMVAVNEALGFEPVEWCGMLQRRL